MLFYVTMVTILMTLLMKKFTSIVWMIEIWMKPMPTIGMKFGVFYILTST